ncbi:Group XVI phospholipase A2 [Scophthalmus maximus]|uniref:Group XVI phospholipase A2 n=1 Tax=Scophthalmus maximus TaxID=52904 RepID=A0A2U9CHE2_SCOMX|nr:Group XVI phospholipase A2 [Scophthalmus maximus]
MEQALFDHRIFRGSYEHWAIYVGGEEVVHLIPPQEESGASDLFKFLDSSTAQVRRQKLGEVVGFHRFRINNLRDGECEPRERRAIVRDACAMVGRELPYCLATSNCEHFVTELRYGKPKSQQFDHRAKPGDLIEIFRGSYEHWAVYVGGEEVVHLIPPQEESGASDLFKFLDSSTAQVRRQKLGEVVGFHRFRINNLRDGECEPRERRAIVRDACAMVGRELPYCLATSNCEHFVTELRYGKPKSQQTELGPKPDLSEPMHVQQKGQARL